jgi:hypothetical protein
MDVNHEDEIVELKQKHTEDRQKLKEQYELYLKKQEKRRLKRKG